MGLFSSIHWPSVGKILTIATVVCGILSGLHFGLMTPAEKVADVQKFANYSLGTAMGMIVIFTVLIGITANKLLETPDTMNMLLFGQGITMLISGSILIYVILNIRYG